MSALASEFDRFSRLTEELCGYVPDPVGTPEEIAAEHISWCRRRGMTPAEVVRSVGRIGTLPQPMSWDYALIAITRAARHLRQLRRTSAGHRIGGAAA